jgi:hypothetical protein
VISGSYFATQYGQAQRRLREMNGSRVEHRYSEAVALDAARQRNHALMFVSFGGAAAAGVTAIVLW